MAFSVKYQPLFKVDILHHYFLNKGDIKFTTMNDDDKAKQLEIYNIHSSLTIIPSNETQQQMNGHGLVFKPVNTGFTIWTRVNEPDNSVPFIAIEDELYFTFLVQIKDALFYNYTDLEMSNAGKLYYLSNRRLPTEPGSFPLINKAGGNKNVDDTFILTEDSAEAELDVLDVDEKKNLFGIIRIYIKADIGSLNVTNVQGEISNPFKTFEIVFKNRKTIWRYFFDSNQQVTGNDVQKENGNSKILISKKEQPLTQTGFITLKLGDVDLPNPSARIVKPDTVTNKYYSEIYM